MLYHERKPADPVRVQGPLSIAVAPLRGMEFSDEDNPSGMPTEMLANDECRSSDDEASFDPHAFQTPECCLTSHFPSGLDSHPILRHV